MKVLYTLFLILSLSSFSAQDIKYLKSMYNRTGEGGTMVTPDVNFINNGFDTITVYVKRFYKNLPTNWTSCFCFISCHLPTEDTLRFKLAPGEKTGIGVGFSTDTIPAIGYVKITVEQVGGTQKDTLSFSGSTMIASILENSADNSFSVFPNPSSDELIFRSSVKETFTISIFDINGQLVRAVQITSDNTKVNIQDLPSGKYFIRSTFNNPIKSQTSTIIKT